MVNEEVLAQLIYKNTEKLFTMKKLEIYMYIERRGWVKAKLLLTHFYYIEKVWLVGISCKYTKFDF